MIIHSYKSSRGKDLIMDYILDLETEEKIDGLSVLQDIENDKWDTLFTKPWQKKIYEVYFRKNNRIFYVTIDNNEVYLLHACRKQKNKTEKKDTDLVIKRAKQLEKQLNKKFT